MQRTSKRAPIELCLNFSNTVDWRASQRPIEKLQNYSDLVRWSFEAGILDRSTSKILLRESARGPSKAQVALKSARKFREVIYRIYSAISHNCNPQAKDLELLNQSVSRALMRLEIVREGGANQFSWKWNIKKNAIDQMISPIAKSAADLLVSEKLRLVKECANEKEGCGWLFIDTSKNRSRRWCSMSSCGNRNKVRSYYEREKFRIK